MIDSTKCCDVGESNCAILVHIGAINCNLISRYNKTGAVIARNGVQSSSERSCRNRVQK